MATAMHMVKKSSGKENKAIYRTDVSSIYPCLFFDRPFRWYTHAHRDIWVCIFECVSTNLKLRVLTLICLLLTELILLLLSYTFTVASLFLLMLLNLCCHSSLFIYSWFIFISMLGLVWMCRFFHT